MTIFFLFVLFGVYQRATGTLSVQRIVTSGPTVLVIRLPSDSSERSDQIVYSQHNDLPHWRAIYGPAAQVGANEGDYHLVHLSAAQWEVIASQRDSWCQQETTYPDPVPSQPFYDVGVDCGGLRGKRLTIPVDVAPSSIVQIVRFVTDALPSSSQENQPSRRQARPLTSPDTHGSGGMTTTAPGSDGTRAPSSPPSPYADLRRRTRRHTVRPRSRPRR